jgi:hypothetical protein
MFRRMKKIAYETRLFEEKQVVALNFFQITEIFLPILLLVTNLWCVRN